MGRGKRTGEPVCSALQGPPGRRGKGQGASRLASPRATQLRTSPRRCLAADFRRDFPSDRAGPHGRQKSAIFVRRVRSNPSPALRLTVKNDNVNYFSYFDGGRTRARTLDPLIKSQLLYQLSYAPIEITGGIGST